MKSNVIKFWILSVVMLALSVSSQAKKKDILSREDGSITFRVDKDLPAPTGEGITYANGGQLADYILGASEIDNCRVVAYEVGNDNLAYYGSTPFFKGMIDAFADHRPVILTPDVIWNLICQGFAHHVNNNPEQLRNLFVDYEGKIDLVVKSDADLLDGETDWSSIVAGFAEQIKNNTKGEIAQIISAPFSTTGTTEQMVSQMALMETVKSYFNYVVIRVVCGIPTITLKGTPADWQSVLERTRQLKDYGLDWWVDELEPILTEFVQASDGKPNVKFWMNIVKKYRPGQVKRGGGCSMDTNLTEFDGWFLKFMPYDKNGRTPQRVKATHSMLSEMVRTEYKYIVIDADGDVQSESMMEFWSGIVGMEVDPATKAMTPKLGWFTRVSETQEEIVARLQKQDAGLGINLQVNKVPDALKQFDKISSLKLTFVSKVVIPEWMDRIKIDSFTVSGSLTAHEKADLKSRFPGITIINR